MDRKRMNLQKFLPLVMLALGAGAAFAGQGPVLWLTALLAAGLAFFGSDGRASSYEASFPASPIGAFGQFFMGGCLGATVLLCPPAMAGGMGTLWTVLGWLGCAGALLAGFFRFQGKKPSFFLHLPLCLFLTIHIVSHYQQWSSTPSLGQYLLPMLGAMSLMFFSYYHMAFSVGLGKRRPLLVSGLLSIYLSFAAIPGSGYPLLYLGGLVWGLTGLCRLGDKL